MADAKRRVLLLAGRFEVRGSSAYTLRLAEHLPGCSNFFPQIVCQDARVVDAVRREGLKIHEYPYLTMPLWGRVVRTSLLRDLEREPPDLIHVQTYQMLGAGTWLARRLNRPLVLTVHDYLPLRVRLALDRRVARRIIAVSDSVCAALRDRTGLPPEMVRIIHPGVEPVQNPELLPVLDPARVPVVGTASPLETVKGLPFFLGAAQRVLAVHQPVEFLVTGAGPEEANLRRLARELGVDQHVTFIPNLRDFTQALAAMDLFCLPSLQQGLGTIMLEAMSLARPVIASDVGGVYSVVRDGETGLLVPASDSSRLADRILELLRDPVRARAIGEAGRQLVLQKFGIEKMTLLTAEVYRQALDDWTGEARRAVALAGSKTDR